MKKIVYILTAVIFLVSCSVQKRKYQKGFYVSGKHAKTQVKKTNATVVKKEAAHENILQPVETVTENSTEVYVSSETKIKPIKATRSSLFNFSKDEPCDKITLKNGDEISAKVLEVTNFEVKYKKCDLANGPLYVVKKSDVFMIHYANGTKEVFKSEPKTTTSSNNNSNNTNNNSTYNGPKATHELAILSLVFGILGFVFFFGSIPAIFAGSAALRKIRAHPDKYDGEDMAKIGRILGIIGITLKIALLIFFIAVVMAI